jgi:hypothetical protein
MNRPILLFIIFLLGLIYYSKAVIYEGFDSNNNNNKKQCPNILIQKGKRFYLHNSNLAKVPGVNPIEFENLEDYTEFLEWQRGQGIRCPVLYLQEIYDAQGNSIYKTRPSVSDLHGGLPPTGPNPTLLVDATRDDPPYNDNSYPGFDTTDYYVGTTTPLDNMNKEHNICSDDAMDPNWCGNTTSNL